MVTMVWVTHSARERATEAGMGVDAGLGTFRGGKKGRSLRAASRASG